MIAWIRGHLWPQVSGTLAEWQKDDTGQYAAALSFYTAFSFFPLLLVLLAGIGYSLRVSGYTDLEAITFLLNPIREHVSAHTADQLKSIILGVEKSVFAGGPSGFLMLLFGAIGIFSNLESAFARIWREYLVPPKPGFWPLVQRIIFGRAKAFLVVFGLGLFVWITFIVGLAMSSVTRFVNSLDEQAWMSWVKDYPWLDEIPFGTWSITGLQHVTSICLNMLLLLFLYRIFCPRRIGWQVSIRGSFIASLLWEMGRMALTWYLTRGSYTAYGVVGSFIAIMMWIFYAWNIVFLGAEWGEVAYRLRKEARELAIAAQNHAAITSGLTTTHDEDKPSAIPTPAPTIKVQELPVLASVEEVANRE